jgi:hypothetical protein
LLVRAQAPTGRTVRLELSNLFPSDPHALFEGGTGGGGILKISNCNHCLSLSLTIYVIQNKIRFNLDKIKCVGTHAQ